MLISAIETSVASQRLHGRLFFLSFFLFVETAFGRKEHQDWEKAAAMAFLTQCFPSLPLPRPKYRLFFFSLFSTIPLILLLLHRVSNPTIYTILLICLFFYN